SPVHREYLPTLGPMTYPDATGFAAATADVDLAARASALQDVLTACRTASVTGAGVHTANAVAVAVATANGNRRYFRTSDAEFSMTARTPDGTGSGYAAGNHFDAGKVDVAQIARRAVDKAARSRDPKPIEPGTYPVILEPQAVADLLGFLADALDARTADEGRSAFSAKDGKTRVGEALFDSRLTMRSDPAHPELPAVPATAEGLPASSLTLIRNGVLAQLPYGRFWAGERKQTPTPGPVNYIVESAQPPTKLDAMIATMPRGLLISRFWYVRLVDARAIVLTGLTRDGLWWVEDGVIQRPVRNLRFNQSVLAMLAPGNVEAIGPSIRLAPFMVPALRLSSFAFTSISDAI
ncbi:MAG TPA: metallopeptidase TldD-related protein, partial [Luteitalea sp.]|nr:metallopeptidase TldD-related protein [Luteitalea sp.]